MAAIETTQPGFVALTDDNHAAWVVVSSYIFLLITILVTIIRLIWRQKITRSISIDDVLMTLGTAAALFETISLTISCKHGLGRHFDSLSAHDYQVYSKSLYAAQILTVLGVALAKASVAQTIASLRPFQEILITCHGLQVFNALWAVASILALAFQCALPRPWDYSQRCVDQWALHIAIGAINVATDVLLVLLPLVLMARVQVGTKQRVVLGSLFGVRIVVPIMIVLNLVTSRDFFRASPYDPTWNAVTPVLYSQIMLNLSLITASIPSIKRFLAEFRSFASAAEVTADFEMSMSGDRLPGGDRKSAIPLQSNHHVSGRRGFKGSFGPLKSTTPGTIYDNSQAATTTVERSESVRGLTDNVIMHSIDYTVEFEEKKAENKVREHTAHSSVSDHSGHGPTSSSSSQFSHAHTNSTSNRHGENLNEKAETEISVIGAAR